MGGSRQVTGADEMVQSTPGNPHNLGNRRFRDGFRQQILNFGFTAREFRRIGISNAILAPDPPEHNPLGIPRRRCGASSSPRAAARSAHDTGGRTACHMPERRRWGRIVFSAPRVTCQREGAGARRWVLEDDRKPT